MLHKEISSQQGTQLRKLSFLNVAVNLRFMIRALLTHTPLTTSLTDQLHYQCYLENWVLQNCLQIYTINCGFTVLPWAIRDAINYMLYPSPIKPNKSNFPYPTKGQVLFPFSKYEIHQTVDIVSTKHQSQKNISDNFETRRDFTESTSFWQNKLTLVQRTKHLQQNSLNKIV
jgi:hypothetical protein